MIIDRETQYIVDSGYEYTFDSAEVAIEAGEYFINKSIENGREPRRVSIYRRETTRVYEGDTVICETVVKSLLRKGDMPI